MIRVHLTEAETRFAMNVGVARLGADLYANLGGRYGKNEDLADRRCEIDIVGALGEMAVAKALDKFWAGALGNFKAADVGRVQVRATARLNGSLLLHSPDTDEAAFVLVVGLPPDLWIPGWILARAGKNSKWVRKDTGRPAFFVPQAALRPLTELASVAFSSDVVDEPRGPADPVILPNADPALTTV